MSILAAILPRMLWPRFLAVVVVAGLLQVGCTTSTPRVATTPTLPGWQRASPGTEGLDPDVVAQIDRSVKDELNGITSVLAARHGRLTIERYYGIRATDQVPVFSITKTVVSAVVGIAIAERHLEGVDERLDDIIGAGDPRITLRDLLSMTAGYGRALSYGPADASTLATRPLVTPPGTTFRYDSGSSDLLAAILARATGMNAAEYARRRLFEPLGIRGVVWPGARGASGLLLRPRELLAFGQMYLNHGTWHGTQIVPASWVRSSTRKHVAIAPDQNLSDGYGYNWWVVSRPPRSYQARGYLGQTLVVLPGLGEVVAVTSSGSNPFPLVDLIVKATRP